MKIVCDRARIVFKRDKKDKFVVRIEAIPGIALGNIPTEFNIDVGDTLTFDMPEMLVTIDE